jgi:thiosulfate/3-mercaptopyruvate sulfurtransferase
MKSPNPLISAPWLYEHLDDPQVAIADCRFSLTDPDLGRRQYQTGHLPGAYYFDLNRDLSGSIAKHGGRHPLPNPEALAAKLGAIGINTTNPEESKLIVAYDDSRFAFAARFWWLLRYLGYDNVAVLDGGFSRWQQMEYPITEAIPEPKGGSFVPHLRSDWVVDIETVKARKDLPGVVLVDSREGERYRGEREPIDPVAGHIPGAMNYPWQEVTDVEGYGRSPVEQQQRWRDIEHAKEVLVYCGSGVTACVNLLAMESWSDWCSYILSD